MIPYLELVETLMKWRARTGRAYVKAPGDKTAVSPSPAPAAPSPTPAAPSPPSVIMSSRQSGQRPAVSPPPAAVSPTTASKPPAMSLPPPPAAPLPPPPIGLDDPTATTRAAPAPAHDDTSEIDVGVDVIDETDA
jgi:hypothetical protein